MNKISSRELPKLINADAAPPAVTLYIPTHKLASPQHISENHVRFKNLRAKAQDALNARDKHNPFNRQFEKACEGLLEDQEFWGHTSESMLICARPGMFEYYHLPVDADEYVFVSDHLYLAPVIGLLGDFQEYYVLCISQHNPMLFKGDAYGLAATDVELPKSIEEALNIDEMHVRSLQFSSIQGGKGAEFHGHGAVKDTGDEERLRFFRIIDNIVCKKTASPLPLVLAGSGSETAEYSSISRRQNLLRRHVAGHFSDRNAEELHRKSRQIIEEEIITPSHQNALDEFTRLKAAKTAENFADIKKAAELGQIQTLLVAMKRETRDTVRDTMSKVRKLVFPAEKVSQAVDHIARLVVNQSGKIINLSQEEMPKGKLMLSIKRY